MAYWKSLAKEENAWPKRFVPYILEKSLSQSWKMNGVLATVVLTKAIEDGHTMPG